MPFTMPSFPLLTPEQANPLLYGAQIGQSMAQKGLQTPYIQRMMEADIFNKTIGPLAQMSISPLALAMQPEQQQQIANLISRILKNYPEGSSGGLFGGGGNVGGGGTLSPTMSKLSTQLTNAQPGQVTTSSKGSNLLPQTDLRSGAVVHTTAPYMSQPGKPGELYRNPYTGDILSFPATSDVAEIQANQRAIDSTIPILERLGSEAEPFLKTGGTTKKILSQVAGEAEKAGIPEKYTKKVSSREMADKWANFQSTQIKSVDKLLASMNLPKDQETVADIKKIIQPAPGESFENYKSRILKDLIDLRNTKLRNINRLGQGYETQAPTLNQNIENNLQSNKPSKGANILANGIELPPFKNQEDFQNWFKRQPKITQDAVVKHLGGK